MDQEYLDWSCQWIRQEQELKLLFLGENMVAASPSVSKMLPAIQEGASCEEIFGEQTALFRSFSGKDSVYFSGKFAGEEAGFLISGRQELTLVQVELLNHSVCSGVLRSIGEELQISLSTLQAVMPKLLPELEETEKNLLYAAQANRSLYKMIRLQRNLMTAAKLDKALNLNLRRTFMCAWLEELGEELRPYVEAAGRHLELKIRWPKTGDYGCILDEGQMKRVILNLLSNSLKYTKEGGKLELSLKKEASGRIHIALKDDGRGISDQDMGKLFRRAERTELISEPEWGSGLGLVVSRAIVQSHGGNLLVQSREGKGTTVHVMLDLIPGKGVETVKMPIVEVSGGLNNILVELVDTLPDDYYDSRGIHL